MGYYWVGSSENPGVSLSEFLRLDAFLYGYTQDNREAKMVNVRECPYQDVGVEPGGTTKMMPTAESTIEMIKNSRV